MQPRLSSGRTIKAGSISLPADERREQLLRVGAEMFSSRAYDEVEIGEVAKAAGVSRGLLYHYFPGKRAFYAAIVQAQSDELARATDTDVPGLDSLRSMIDAYFHHAEEHEAGYRAMHRGASSADPAIRAIVDRSRDLHASRLLSFLPEPFRSSPTARVTVNGWFSLVISICLDWLDDRQLKREWLREICLDALVAALMKSYRLEFGENPPEFVVDFGDLRLAGPPALDE
jgi:AcrR family transcriptional regulator